MRTYWEAVVERVGERYLLAYIPRKTRRALFNAVRNRGEAFVRFTGADRVMNAENLGLETANGWRVRYSGRTMRDAKNEGELVYFKESLQPQESEAGV
ncbi:MAG TPA: hypothetical protein PK468_16465 [Candidatus Hydrogenedentes bacterium]|jgi:hypothetical protein|nr:hypothetical protein [Candidatus Hydrogenedentota bacterium]